MENKISLNDFLKLVEEYKETGNETITIKTTVLLDLIQEIRKSLAINNVLSKILVNKGVDQEEINKAIKDIEGGDSNVENN